MSGWWEPVMDAVTDNLLGWRYYSDDNADFCDLRIYLRTRDVDFFNGKGVMKLDVPIPASAQTEEEIKAWTIGYWRTIT